MTRYKFDKRSGLVDDEGKIVLQLVAVGCSQSFRVTAGKELANKLNGVEQGKEAALRANELRQLRELISRYFYANL